VERQRIDRQGDLVTECAVAELLEEGELQRHVRRVRRIYHGRRDALVAALQRHLPGRLSAEPPPGGMALWARVEGVDVERWAERAAAHGLGLYTARWFAFDGQPAPYLRLGFALRSAEETARAIEQLARLCPEPLPRRKVRGAQSPEVPVSSARWRPGPPALVERALLKRALPKPARRRAPSR
jgi:GntR family transcriptional regulator/MocR family aminotransferase